MKILKFYKINILLVAVFVLFGCSTSNKGSLLPANLTHEPTDYLIGPGDNLNVFGRILMCYKWGIFSIGGNLNMLQ